MLAANKYKMVRQRDFMDWCSTLGWRYQGGLLETPAQSQESPLVESPATSGLVGYEYLDPNVSTDRYGGSFRIPTHWDLKNPIYVRVVFANGAPAGTAGTAGQAVVYQMLYGQMDSGDDFDTSSPPATALSVVIPNFTLPTGTVAGSLYKTAPGIIYSSVLTTKPMFYFRVNAVANAANVDTTVYGVEFEYTPKFYKGYIPEAPEWQDRQR